jgi:hypothetical protein
MDWAQSQKQGMELDDEDERPYGVFARSCDGESVNGRACNSLSVRAALKMISQWQNAILGQLEEVNERRSMQNPSPIADSSPAV